MGVRDHARSTSSCTRCVSCTQEITDPSSKAFHEAYYLYDGEFPESEKESADAFRRWLTDKAEGKLESDNYHLLAMRKVAKGPLVAVASFHYVAATSPMSRNPHGRRENPGDYPVYDAVLDFRAGILMYRGHADEVRDKRWAGWDEYISDFCKRPNFVKAWKDSGSTFDDDFNRFMFKKMGQSGTKL